MQPDALCRTCGTSAAVTACHHLQVAKGSRSLGPKMLGLLEEAWGTDSQ